MRHRLEPLVRAATIVVVCCLSLVVVPEQARGLQATAAPAYGHVIEDGQAQVVEAFADSTRWIREQLWVETNFDSDGDGRPDRMHVTVVRPEQTETAGMQVPAIYETSPYFGGSASVSDILWNVEHELGQEPPPRGEQPYV